jgi:hypothetical protein
MTEAVVPRKKLWDVARALERAQEVIASARAIGERSRSASADEPRPRPEPGDEALADVADDRREHVTIENDIRDSRSGAEPVEIDPRDEATLRTLLTKPAPRGSRGPPGSR